MSLDHRNKLFLYHALTNRLLSFQALEVHQVYCLLRRLRYQGRYTATGSVLVSKLETQYNSPRFSLASLPGNTLDRHIVSTIVPTRAPFADIKWPPNLACDYCLGIKGYTPFRGIALLLWIRAREIRQ